MRGGGHIRKNLRWALYLRDGLACRYCEKSLQDLLHDREFLTLDHVHTVHQGGLHTPDNLVAACYPCNVLRGRQPLAIWWRTTPRAFSYDRLRTRMSDARLRWKDKEARLRGQADVLLGGIPGVACAAIVQQHEHLVQQQWGRLPEWLQMQIGYETEQQDLVCPTCLRPTVDVISPTQGSTPWGGQVSEVSELEEDFGF